MIRVLHVFHEMVNGGTGHFVMNYYRHIDRNKVQFDFLTSVPESGYWDEEILSLGGKLFHAYPFNRNPFRNYMDIAKIVRENGYQIVHRHTGSAFGYYDLRAARRGGARQLILHAHNTEAGKPVIHKLSNLLKVDCHHFACSQMAGEFLFGAKKEFELIPNAIDIEKFSYNSAIRAEIRRSLNLNDQLVVGHIGRFETQKNHKRLISVFSEIHKKQANSVLVCVGAGSMLEEMRKTARAMGIEDAVLFLGQRDDVADILQAVDVFVFPSLYEGFPITIIEAQASGLPCFVSIDVVPKEVNISGNVHFISLNEPDTVWADQILSSNLNRKAGTVKMIQEAGYDIRSEAEKLTQRYIRMAEESF